MQKHKAMPDEFACSSCGVAVAKFVPVFNDNEPFVNAKIEQYDNWSPPKNGKIICKECRE